MTRPDINWGKVCGIGLIAIGILQGIPPTIQLARAAWTQHQFEKEYEFSSYMDSAGHRLTPEEYQKARNPQFSVCYRHRQTQKEKCVGG
ncbi:MAG: hypothetical protein HC860_16250 [Alkalinema sp. RU_4_3]|nr:hypothetical protein [Alkalinema sp. RU_4_3]